MLIHDIPSKITQRGSWSDALGYSHCSACNPHADLNAMDFNENEPCECGANTGRDVEGVCTVEYFKCHIF